MTRVPIEEIETTEDFIHSHDGVLFTGTIVELHPDGTVAAEIAVVDGVEHGRERGYYPSGQLKYEYDKVEASIVASRLWHENGQLAEEATYKASLNLVWDDRERCLSRRKWDEGGKPISRV